MLKDIKEGQVILEGNAPANYMKPGGSKNTLASHVDDMPNKLSEFDMEDCSDAV